MTEKQQREWSWFIIQRLFQRNVRNTFNIRGFSLWADMRLNTGLILKKHNLYVIGLEGLFSFIFLLILSLFTFIFQIPKKITFPPRENTSTWACSPLLMCDTSLTAHYLSHIVLVNSFVYLVSWFVIVYLCMNYVTQAVWCWSSVSVLWPHITTRRQRRLIAVHCGVDDENQENKWKHSAVK